MSGGCTEKDVAKLASELAQGHDLAEQREHERDLAQEELFRPLYEERELNKEKIQFQSQLSEYEKYAALAQLALEAAHEINDPMPGILSHLELEFNATVDPEQRMEVEQCIAGARRVSSTLRGLDKLKDGDLSADLDVSPTGRQLVTLRELEDDHIQEVLAATGNNKTQASRILGIHPTSLLRRLK